MKKLLAEIRKCDHCANHLELGPNPILSASTSSKIILIGQAPGLKVHNSGIPWADQSGRRLRNWLGISEETFYSPDNIALLPMGFCYPGKGRSGDLPPRPECAPLWHEKLLSKMKQSNLTLLVGSYAVNYYLKGIKKPSLTETVRNYEEYLPDYFPLPHPSPRNGIWLRKNSWFEKEVIPELHKLIHKAL